MNRDIEILCEIIADNLNLLKGPEGNFDEGIYEDVCNNLGFDLAGYVASKKNGRGRFRSND